MIVLTNGNRSSILCLGQDWIGRESEVHHGVIQVLHNDLLSDKLILKGDLLEPFEEGGRVQLDLAQDVQLRHVVEVAVQKVSKEKDQEAKAQEDTVPALPLTVLRDGAKHGFSLLEELNLSFIDIILLTLSLLILSFLIVFCCTLHLEIFLDIILITRAVCLTRDRFLLEIIGFICIGLFEVPPTGVRVDVFRVLFVVASWKLSFLAILSIFDLKKGCFSFGFRFLDNIFLCLVFFTKFIRALRIKIFTSFSSTEAEYSHFLFINSSLLELFNFFSQLFPFHHRFLLENLFISHYGQSALYHNAVILPPRFL